MIHKINTLYNGIIMISAAALMIFSLAGCTAATGQKTFHSGQDATDTFIKALRADDPDELLSIFGTDANELIFSGDSVMDTLRRDMFLEAYDRQHRLDAKEDQLILVVGQNDWPFPIPLIKQDQKWIFDTAAGKEEILQRRIGRNELNTIQVLLAIVDAQREYAMNDLDGDGLCEYAQQFHSEAGKKNGLYWKTEEGEKPSPLGLLVALAKEAGYTEQDKNSANEPQPYFGYFYRMLTAQGQNAPGGAFEYIIKDNMIGGFAVIAYPADYGNSGVMTFVVNHDGIVHQKDLGENTAQEATKIDLFDPNEAWEKVQ
ncbi:MAG: DUF2950 domain-containing protein [Anaerohalosphaeraceae bacterium]